jgi:hypothetical protein
VENLDRENLIALQLSGEAQVSILSKAFLKYLSSAVSELSLRAENTDFLHASDLEK